MHCFKAKQSLVLVGADAPKMAGGEGAIVMVVGPKCLWVRMPVGFYTP